ncbi:uncharacterized protein [Ptychodera flava]|uniref:uncharacterized protein n=1 Tax=Ptychodera flava TaxID=63121 RepID=UPI00396A8783
MEGMSAATKKQWASLTSAADKFHAKTNLDVIVISSHFDKITKKRKYVVHGAEPPIHPEPSTETTPPLPGQSSSTRPQLPDLRQHPNGCLTCLAYYDLRELLPVLVKETERRAQPLWCKEERKPTWWPKDILFENPSKPSKAVGHNWVEQMRRVARACYQHYSLSELTGDVDSQCTYSEDLKGGDRKRRRKQARPSSVSRTERRESISVESDRSGE